MLSNRLTNSSFSGLMGTFIVSFVAHINYNILPNLLSLKGFTQSDLDNLVTTELFAQIIASMLLVPLINSYNLRKVMVLTLLILLFCLLNLTIIEQHHLLKLHMLLISACSLIYLSVSFINFISKSDNKISLFTIFSIVWAAGYLCGDIIMPLMNQVSNELSVLFVSLFFLLLAIYHYLQKPLKVSESDTILNFEKVLSGMEIEALSGFIIAYVLSSTHWWYEIIALVENFAVSGISTLRSYLVLCIITSLLPVTIIIPRFSKNTIILCSYVTLLVIFSFLSKYASDLVINTLLILVISFCLICIIVCNILTLNAKFTHKTFKIALAVYIISLALGSYTGPISTDAALDNLGEIGFSISICLCIGLFITYFAWYFKKNKLYKW